MNKYFNRDEFACKCGNDCGKTAVDAELLAVLTDLREWGGVVIVNSGNRCTRHNRLSGGSPKSQHLHALAADIRMPNKTPDEVVTYLDDKYPDKYGIGLYTQWTHIDVRPNRARW